MITCLVCATIIYLILRGTRSLYLAWRNQEWGDDYDPM